MQNGTITCYLPCNMLLSSSKLNCTIVNVCVVGYNYVYCMTSEWNNLGAEHSTI